MSTKDTISFDNLVRLDIRVGTVISIRPNRGARVPAFEFEIDFGVLGIKRSSAQVTENYDPSDLEGRQIVAIVNFPAKRVSSVKSEVLVLAAVCGENGTVLLTPERLVKNGTSIA